MHFFFTWKRREQTKYKSHGKTYPKWLQTLLDRNWEGVAWNLIQGMAQCFFTQCFLFVWGKTFQTICYYDSWLCQALPWAKWNWLPCCPLPGQGQPWHTRNGALQSCWQHPQVFICALCQLPWRIFFFLPFFLIYCISCPHPEQQKGVFGILLPTAEHALEHPALLGLNPLGTWTFQHQAPLNKCLF